MSVMIAIVIMFNMFRQVEISFCYCSIFPVLDILLEILLRWCTETNCVLMDLTVCELLPELRLNTAYIDKNITSGNLTFCTKELWSLRKFVLIV